MDQGAVYRTVVFSFLSGSIVINSIISIASGQCIPGWLIATLLLVCGYLGLVLLLFSSSNAQVDAISKLFLQARDELLFQLAQPGYDTDPIIERNLRCQADLLAAMADCDRYKARFLGFAISFAVLRTIVATMLTLAIGLLSIMRGSGVFLTLKSYCPLR